MPAHRTNNLPQILSYVLTRGPVCTVLVPHCCTLTRGHCFSPHQSPRPATTTSFPSMAQSHHLRCHLCFRGMPMLWCCLLFTLLRRVSFTCAGAHLAGSFASLPTHLPVPVATHLPVPLPTHLCQCPHICLCHCPRSCATAHTPVPLPTHLPVPSWRSMSSLGVCTVQLRAEFLLPSLCAWVTSARPSATEA